jgi:hypothetical protein
VLTKGTNCPNKFFYVSYVDLQIICVKYGLETLISPNDKIRKYLHDMKHSWSENVFWDVNNKKLRKWCKFVSHFLFNNSYGLPVLTMETKCPNQIFYVWKVDLQTICAKWGLEMWFFPNNDIRICLFDVKNS